MRRIPVYFPSWDTRTEIEVGVAGVLEDGRIGIRFHDTEVGNKLIEIITGASVVGLNLSYHEAKPIEKVGE